MFDPNKYIGRQIDFDGYYGFQCFDLANQYSVDIGGRNFTGLNASDIFGQQPGKYDWIKNSSYLPGCPTGVPPNGAIVVWDGGINNGPGHVAIATGEGDTNTFVSIDQNWGADRVTKVRHNYNHVIGWGVPKGVTNMANYTEEKINQGDVTNVIRVLLGRDASPDDISFALVDCGASWKKWVYEGILKHPGLFENWKAEVARRDAIIAEKDKTIADLTEKLKTAQNGSGGLSEADRATITETNGIVKQIWAKITGIFK